MNEIMHIKKKAKEKKRNKIQKTKKRKKAAATTTKYTLLHIRRGSSLNRHMSNHTRACFILNLRTPQTLIISDE